MIYTEKTKLAMKIAYLAHKDQMDRSGLPYVFHPFSVANLMNDETSTIVALLHDTLEDTSLTEQDLIDKGIDKEIITIIILLTKQPNEDYFSYIDRIKTNETAIKVKLGDLSHNMKTSRLSTLNERDILRLEKYKKAKRELEHALLKYEKLHNTNT